MSDKEKTKADIGLVLLAIGIALLLAVFVHNGYIGKEAGDKLIDTTLDIVPTAEAPHATTE